MPMRSWAKIAAAGVLALAGCASARPVSGLQSRTEKSALKVDFAGRPASVQVALDRGDVDAANDHVVTQLGTRGGYLLLTDSYASRPQPLSRCGAGHETWVRLIDTRMRVERWSKRVESCLHDIEPGDPVAAWTQTGTGFTVNLLSEPAVHVTVGTDGRVAESAG